MLVTVKRACGALAITSNWKGWGRGYGEDYKSAQFDAVNNCQRGNPEGDCASIRWVCAYPHLGNGSQTGKGDVGFEFRR
jgi:hypothetical protein